MSFPSPRHHTNHHEIPPLLGGPLRADKISTADIQDTVERKHPAHSTLCPCNGPLNTPIQILRALSCAHA